MNIHWLLFGLCVAMVAVLVVVMMTEEVPYVEETVDGTVTRTAKGHGMTHATHTTMQFGRPGAERHEPILWHGLVLALLESAFFVTLLAFGARRNENVGKFLVPLGIGFVLYAAMFVMLFLSYRGYMTEDTHALFASFPKPTAWMVYGVWGMPAIFIFLYASKFTTWYMTEEDEKKFAEIVAERHAAQGNG